MEGEPELSTPTIEPTATLDPNEPMTIAENDPLDGKAEQTADQIAKIRPAIAAKDAPAGTLIDPEAPFGDHDVEVDIPFGSLPPRGGVHHPIWQTCMIYFDPVEPKYAVHSMEHGAVWVTYQPEMSARDKAVLQNVVGVDPYVLLSPYPGLQSPVVLTAWGLQLEVDDVEDPRIPEFINTFKNGIQTPEIGAPCTGGTQVTVDS